EIVMKLLKRFDDQIVDREPDRSAPVRVPAKQTGARFSRLVGDAMLAAIHLENVRLVFVSARKSPNAVRRQKLLFVEHHRQHSPQLVAIDYRKQPSFMFPASSHAGDISHQVLSIGDKPFQSPLESWELIQ